MICINLTSDSQLFLTPAEATQLALDLESQLQAAHEIIIADVPLTETEAWRLLEIIEDLLKGCSTRSVNWKVEGF